MAAPRRRSSSGSGRTSARRRQPTRSRRAASRTRSRRERKHVHLACYLAFGAAGLWLTLRGTWIALPVALLVITVMLGFRWPTLCRAYRTDDGICETPVNGWLTGCASHAPFKRRDLRAVAWPPNRVSPFHPIVLALRIPPREPEAQPDLDGAPRRVTMRNLVTSLVLAVAVLMTGFGLLLGAA
ncbi:hypothetical protein ThrDRAFT_02492 [Frankia casuarinae]|uniref:Uncharacterized protein n=1 Tax=Frankia casuarinae (strain DSM 45818 / CECT 9043 / HFP020203 / CcI3) TaxID=106370 RepID=Q2J9D2_FRACC|nr:MULTISPECIES: hypothetical protein [Frankia]ABD12110.1 hypothetical protein Francci3_2750 [Frankia casuarinae]ETA00532.1 hypothetical protein CcI6DRAFT_04056 [Frankia sp. CcI6]EYT91847.1 hypothetical protein ThrDRAFT_02492 [Frankia casuarinae]KDA41016.1 hypothetical protein BMG523Draft_04173 [Frankia sp. BMG5.23]KEZ34839.1 hypothetical protein CEDDRAFT_03829 [Frankia sp. CeD]